MNRIVYGVKFEGPTGNCYWFRFGNRVRRLPQMQVTNRATHLELQNIVVSESLFEELQRAKLIDEHGRTITG